MLVEEFTESDVAERAEFVAPLAPRARDRVADAAEHDVARHLIKLEAAAGGEEREVVSNLALDVGA